MSFFSKALDTARRAAKSQVVRDVAGAAAEAGAEVVKGRVDSAKVQAQRRVSAAIATREADDVFASMRAMWGGLTLEEALAHEVTRAAWAACHKERQEQAAVEASNVNHGRLKPPACP